MRAAVITRYGSPDVIEIREVAKPSPKAGEVLVKVHASTVSRTDSGFLRAHPFAMRLFTGLRRPRQQILGMDFAGVVEAVGAGVQSLRPGARVFGLLRWRELGGHAEYVCVPEAAYIAEMPAGVTFEQAVIGEGAFYAYASLIQLDLKRGQRILIYGASGAIGTAAVQLARSWGAEVTAVVDTRHVELAKSLGAARVIDYTVEDFTRIGETFDCILDAVGKASYLRCRRLLKPGGMFAATDAGPKGLTLLFAIWSLLTGSRRVRTVLPRRVERFVDSLKEWIEAGEIRAVIDRRYPLEAIADAYRYVELGQKTGIVVINVTPAIDPQS